MQFAPFFSLVFLSSLTLVMAPKVGKKYKTKANRTTTSSSTPTQVDNRVRFPTTRFEEIFKSLTKFRSIWGER